MERMNEKIGQNVCIELKNGSKYFGILKSIDESPKQFSWYVLDIRGKETDFNDTEIIKMEVLG